MAKNKEENQESKQLKKSKLKSLGKLLILLSLMGIVVFSLQNPQLLKEILPAKDETASNDEKIAMQQAIGQIQKQIFALHQKIPQVDMSAIANINEKFDTLEKNNLNIINSKADVAALMGAITRLDKLEAELEKAIKVTDEGALVLTAVMLVKDSADQGGIFEYEAEILQQITADNPSLKEPVAEIISLAKEGVNSKQFLQYEFMDIYKKLKKKQKRKLEENLSWKQRLNAKLGELVQVKKTNYQEKEAEAGLEIIKRFVEAGELSKAINELELSGNMPLLQNASLEKWYKQAKQRELFDRAVSRIAASSLALMKVNFIKKAQ